MSSISNLKEAVYVNYAVNRPPLEVLYLEIVENGGF